MSFSKNNILIKFWLLTTIFVVFFSSLVPMVYAQTDQSESSISSNPALKLDLNVDEQFHPSKEFTIKLEIDSLINSNRVGIDWTYPKALLNAVNGESDVISVSNGNKTIFIKTFRPKADLPSSGSNRKIDISVRVVGYSAGDSYISTGKTSLTLNSNMEVVPLLEGYSRSRTINTIINITIVLGLVALIIGVVIFLLKKFLKYLNTPDVN